MKNDEAELYAKQPMEDKLLPSFAPNDGTIIATRISQEISYYFMTKAFIKRQPHADDMDLDAYGNTIVISYIEHRLRKEAAALQFIRQHTGVSYPRFWPSGKRTGSSISRPASSLTASSCAWSTRHSYPRPSSA